MSQHRPPQDAPPEQHLSSRGRRLGAVLWPSFFAAGVASMVFFAVVDPTELAEMTWPQLQISRELGYTLGFFMFWACTFSACFFTALLLDSPAAPIKRRTGVHENQPW